MSERPNRAPKEKLVPIREESESVSYLGVELPKATDTEHAPKKEQYADYVNDAFSLELQKKLAISWKQGDPVLVEGGTTIGKTTTVRKMCADLGYEVHYVNLNGATDIEDLMGRYIPNRDRKAPADPEYVFADGKVTSALRQETGKVKVLLLDEYNSAAPNIVIRLHEVLDALERDGEVVLAEDASERIRVNKGVTKVAALTNPPGRGYLQREPLDPAQLRRWVYVKETNDLSPETLQHAARALFSLEGKTQDVPESSYLFANDAVLTPEQLKEIPGIEDILPKYLEFHAGAKELLRNRTIAADQPQKFTFDDREEPKRVRDFIAAFYRGDLNQTMQDALRYYYAGKLLERADKEKLEQLIRTVEYVPAQNSNRRALEPEEAAMPQGAAAAASTPEGAAIAEAERIMGKENFLGREDVESVFGVTIDRVQPVPFSKQELERAKALGQQLILQIDFMKMKVKKTFGGTSESVGAITLQNLKKQFEKAHDGAPMFYTQDWYNDEDFFKSEKPRVGWKLTSKEVIPDSASKNYLDQTDALASYLTKEAFKGMAIPAAYDAAIAQFTAKRAEIARLIGSDWQKASQALADLDITKLTRETPVEAMYRLILQDGARKQKLIPSMYTWTGRRVSGGYLVYVGGFGGDGARVAAMVPAFRLRAWAPAFPA